MTYTVATMAAAPDPNEFLEIFNANARPALESAGGSAIRVSQSVMSGDMTGRLTIAVDFDSISAAFEGSLGAGAAVRPAAREAGIELMSRSLVLTKEERGATDGAFGSLMQVTGDPIDDRRRHLVNERGYLLGRDEFRSDRTEIRSTGRRRSSNRTLRRRYMDRRPRCPSGSQHSNVR